MPMRGRMPSGGASRLAGVKPWAALAGGGALAVAGLARRSWPGAALAAAGGYLAYRGAAQNTQARRLARGIHADASVIVNRSPEELYAFWRDVSNMPRFMRYVESARELEDGRSRWRLRSPAGALEFHSRIIHERPGESLSWRTEKDAPVEHSGSVEFKRLPGDRGTQVAVLMRYRAPGAGAAAVLAGLAGQEPEQVLREDLRRFKQLVEAGEIASVAGQPSGRRSAKGAMLQSIFGEGPSRQPRRPAAAS